MGHWELIRQKARTHYSVVRTLAANDSAPALLAAAVQITGITPQPVLAGDSLLDGGESMLDLETGVIWFNCNLPAELVAFYQAHEYAHFWLEHPPVSCTAEQMDTEVSEEPVPVGIQRVEGYSPEERREREANVFAREFLLPADVLRCWFEQEGLDVPTITARVGLPREMAYHQLARSLLTPNTPISALGEQADAPRELLLDASQYEAATVKHGPFLLEAGPGTGKTHTLMGRILFLLQQGVAPSSILALTFSNRAAEEMRARLASLQPDAAPQLWISTFHAFGLELLRKYGARLGLPPRFALLDPLEAFFLLERHLPSLQLSHYENLYEPTAHLRDLLDAISRAKDELVGPQAYRHMAEHMRTVASSAEELERAEKALEVASVYVFYQRHLEQHHLLDFGDLLFRTVSLLQMYPDVKTSLQQTYPQIVVDEYQDVNRASGILLRELAGAGAGLWVVGDAHQAIYRFRGAAPQNMRLFREEFSGATVHSLGYNYRSQPVILSVFSTLAEHMPASAGAPFSPWIATRPQSSGSVRLDIAQDFTAEVTRIADTIRQHQREGRAFRDQAILCRSHTSLTRLGAALEQAGIPVLYLSALFERPEVRDLLAVLSLSCEANGHGLIRVARFPNYSIPLPDVLLVLQHARERKIPFPRALKLAAELDGLSPEGKAGLARLDSDLDGLCYGSQPWSLLVQYLFTRSEYLHALTGDQSVTGQQQRLAIFQLLQIAHEQQRTQRSTSQDPKRAFLRYIRRLTILGEDRHLRQVPEWADRIDAVRMLTVHASKGLEFPIVYLPYLGQRYFPAPRQPAVCPTPTGLPSYESAEARQEEEECLFFVALSRARDFLYLSCARRYGEQNSNPSSLLIKLSKHFQELVPSGPKPRGKERASLINEETSAAALATNEVELLPTDLFEVDHLELWLRCPRQYYYERVLGLFGRGEESAYRQFHHCVYSVLRWIQQERAAGHIVVQEQARQQLEAVWQTNGPCEHMYEPLYRQQAELMVQRVVVRFQTSLGHVPPVTWEVALPQGHVRFTPDFLQMAEGDAADALIVQRLRTGRLTKTEPERPIYALYQRGAEQHLSAATWKVQMCSLSTDQVENVSLTSKVVDNRLQAYSKAMLGIRNKDFPPQPSERECPRCPFYFICDRADIAPD